MAIVCWKHRLLFIMTPRTACTAIGQLLCERYGGEFLPAEDILDEEGFISVQKKHSTLAQLINRRLITSEQAGSLLKFAAVRNPFESLVSLYFKQRYKYQPLLGDPMSWVNRSRGYPEAMRYAAKHSFNQWVFRVCRRKIAKRLLGGSPSMFAGFTAGMDMIMRFETLETDLHAVFQRAGLPGDGRIPVSNQTIEKSGEHYRTYYSRAAALAAGFAYSTDVRMYRYAF